jgi:hypothetical protein
MEDNVTRRNREKVKAFEIKEQGLDDWSVTIVRMPRVV